MRQQILNLFTTPRDMSWEDILLNIVLAAVLGFFIFLSYAISHRGTIYSRKFNASLVILAVLTGTVMTVIGNNIALSLGMVGALSIVRFRTAVKDPLDTAYMFWALTMGILLGAGQYIIALVVVAAISVVLFALNLFKFTSPNAYLLVLHYDEDAEYDINQQLRRSVKYRRLRSKTVTRGGAEMTVEIRLGNRSDIVGHMLDIKGVHDATLVACQNETGA